MASTAGTARPAGAAPGGGHGRLRGLAIGWIAAALAALALVGWRLGAALPVFTVLWLIVPLVALVRHADPGRVGIRRVPGRALARATLLAAAAVTLLFAALEPWSHAYDELVDEAISADPPDPTFGLVARFDGAGSWAGFVLFGGLVTLFAEELFFRGWLLQLLGRHTRPALAIGGQALAFAALQTLPALMLTPLRAGVYVVAYALVGNGLVCGWAAWSTGSIWPSLAIAATFNPVLTALLA
jgi:membrane protease YdiL (CAAX protease family)